MSSQRLSVGMTPKTLRLPKPGEMLLSVRGSPLGVYKEDNMEAIHAIDVISFHHCKVVKDSSSNKDQATKVVPTLDVLLIHPHDKLKLLLTADPCSCEICRALLTTNPSS
ncbi:hypothetical protein G4B88_015365 [Cannabis sativa]|uniref:Borealin C-terminal domain-containing protein n=1 Tax=Cannabis sativa TaxID=3483 RepID=A0A7J6ECC8_CANSA|nr:hypothetical protein G4B88_015365 [Cannabis sativa]